ncbi:small subunit ribosomal protein S20e [Nematocida sp. AWRm80]|nr:small subunit ribosomal protein S20e [Nematocida sp. AWRm80]
MNHTEKDFEKEIEQMDDKIVHTLRINMVSKNKEELERIAYKIYELAKKEDPTCKGPSSKKNNKLKVTVRKSPCGNGSNTYDKYTMVIRKKYIDVTANYDVFRAITTTVTSPEVFLQVVVKQ